ncbi:MAG: LysR family transcriptional regulator [Saccharospirillaceae bacterium]|nr:LysR family transcriptional regulator [Pseudomonadales bacterium]NRB78726.1 LysR family transcriptional regulator [Saccharospirillaceae bacterium]
MGQLEEMAIFVRIVDAGSISKAAEQLNIAKSAVSRRLNELEKRLGVSLLTRSTRTSSLTDIGRNYYLRCVTLLDDVNCIDAQTSNNNAALTGVFKFTAPIAFGVTHLNAAINEFSNLHPELKFQIDFSEGKIDLIEQGFELAIRIGKLQDSSYQARQITAIEHVICASPKYLKTHKTIKHYQDLEAHSFLKFDSNSTSQLTNKSSHINIIDENNKQQSIVLNPKMSSNNGEFLKQMALNSKGLVYLPTFLIHQELKANTLIPVLSQYRYPQMFAYAVYPKNRFLSQRCRLFIDFICEWFESGV